VQVLSLFLLLLGIAMSSDIMAEEILKNTPGTSKLETIINTRELFANSAIYFTVMGLILGGIGVIGFCGVCCKVKYILYLVSELPVVILLLLLTGLVIGKFQKYAA